MQSCNLVHVSLLSTAKYLHSYGYNVIRLEIQYFTNNEKIITLGKMNDNNFLGILPPLTAHVCSKCPIAETSVVPVPVVWKYANCQNTVHCLLAVRNGDMLNIVAAQDQFLIPYSDSGQV